MSRPEPRVLKEYFKDDGVGVGQICQGESRGIFVVVYRDEPFQYRTKANVEVAYPGWKYLRTAFANSGHAFNLAEKLNKQFGTTDFQVVEMTIGKPVQPTTTK